MRWDWEGRKSLLEKGYKRKTRVVSRIPNPNDPASKNPGVSYTSRQLL
jgi:hypothetical protein